MFIHERPRERQRHRQREKQAPQGEPDVELDPGTLGWHPELKADAQPLSPPGAPLVRTLKVCSRTISNTVPQRCILKHRG